MAYLVQPIRSFSEMAPPYYWLAYEHTGQAAASVIYLALFPLVLVSLPLRDPARCREYAWLVLPFWGFMLTLAVGTAEIHARYRVMSIPFLYACMWLGRGADKGTRVRALLIWITTLIGAGVLYVVFKES
jgi:hypothetical protein